MKKEFKVGFEHILLTATSLGQILCAILMYRQPVDSLVRNIGWVNLWISGILGWLPIFTFKKYGGVNKGDSYVHTQQLVDKGIYSIVRHPQYLAGIFLSIGLFLIAPYWVSLVLGVMNIVQYVHGAIDEEKGLLEKFGQQYKNYQQEVPRFNLLWGVVKRIQKTLKT
jgi:protein-S-isoprenylcysteine O-methyltransferase Ste14